MSWDTDPWMELEAMEAERFEADMEQAHMEMLGRESAARKRRAKALFEAGEIDEAALTCPHGHGYGLEPEYAEYRKDDPRAGQGGNRCLCCGSWIESLGMDSVVLAACEIPGTWE